MTTVVPGRDWVVEAWKPGDEQAILALFRAEFGRERSLAHWRWKFLENPCGGPFISLAWHREKRLLVGNQVLMPFPLCVRGKRVLAGHSLDLVVHHDFRRQGVFEHTGRHAEETLARQGGGALVAFPNASSYPGFVRTLGWKRIVEPTMWKLRLGVRGKLERRLGAPPLAAAADAVYRAVSGAAARRRWRSAETAAPGLRVAHGPRLPEGVDALWEHERSRVTLSLWKDREYLAWRYERHPEQAFEYHSVAQGPEPAGLAITAVRARVAHVCEFLVPGRDLAVARRLLGALCERLSGAGVDEIHFLGHDAGWYAQVFEGFTRTVASENVFVGRAIGDDALTNDMADPGNWVLTYGDGDFV